MIKKLLIANRGEIALRIMASAKELGIKTVIVYSEADKNSMPVQLADEAYCIGPASPSDSYLNIPAIMTAAELSGADAIHPGYGFLSENARFAEIVEASGLVFIGPSPKHIQLMGNKQEARKTMESLGVPILPGSNGVIKRIGDARRTAEKIGYPIILKAVAGGGGRGMRIINTPVELEENFTTAQREAYMAFGSPDLYIEKYIERAHHVEVQVIGDGKKAISIGDRECSMQRRHQKIVEEAPSPFISEETRQRMLDVVEKAATSLKLRSLVTFEFLVDQKENFYFIEANTRIQVEHPVTELVTWVDLIKEQILIASGGKMTTKKENLRRIGHAIEARINAEDPQTFSPSPGKIHFLFFPGGNGIRVDTAVFQGYEIPPYYDSMIAKIIAYGRTRREALRKLEVALKHTSIVGVKTNLPLLLKLFESPEFLSGNYTTRFLEEEFVW
ncbi:MAG: acetyl-CoA carboxylase biotin carboxylase subunit [Candidatus Aminicenantes bacterium]|nr:acetyl-CoA carboxylase biotin carboxylase subunit [Candidatus Aminicenantes bacterium]